MVYGNYPDLTNVKKILVIQLRHLGDVLLTTPLFKILKEKIPRAAIDCYVYQGSEKILEYNPHLNKVISYDQKIKRNFFLKRLVHEAKLLSQFKKEQYDLVINLTEGDRGLIVTRTTKAPIRVGWKIKEPFWNRKKTYTHFIKNTPQERHVIEKNLDALRVIGIYPEFERREIVFPIAVEQKNLVQELYSFSIKEKNFIVIHPTSRWRFKCLPTKTVRNVIEFLLQSGETVLVTCGPDEIEKEMISTILKGLQHDRLFNFSGKFSIKEFGALVNLSKLLFCVDSVSFHIASALKAPVIGFFGPTSEKKWGPWRNPSAKVLTQPYPCRPCFSDGCGGSKMSDCLMTFSESNIFSEIEEVLNQGVKSFPK